MQIRIGEHGNVARRRGLHERRHVSRSDHVHVVALGERGERPHEAPHDRVGRGDERLVEPAEGAETRVVSGKRHRVRGGDGAECGKRRTRLPLTLTRRPAGAREQVSGGLAARPRRDRRQPDVFVEDHHVRPVPRQMRQHEFPEHAVDLRPERCVGHDVPRVLLELHREDPRRAWPRIQGQHRRPAPMRGPCRARVGRARARSGHRPQRGHRHKHDHAPHDAATTNQFQV